MVFSRSGSWVKSPLVGALARRRRRSPIVGMSAAPPLIATYAPPAVRVGDAVYCRYGRARCRVVGWSDSPGLWPLVRGPHGETGPWVNAALARAVRTESSRALMHWFGVSQFLAWRWRKAFGAAGRSGTPGTRRAYHAATNFPGPRRVPAGQPVTHQRESQLAAVARGVCSICFARPLLTKTRCEECAEKVRAYARAKKGCKPWERGKRGRPPAGRQPAPGG